MLRKIVCEVPTTNMTKINKKMDKLTGLVSLMNRREKAIYNEVEIQP